MRSSALGGCEGPVVTDPGASPEGRDRGLGAAFHDGRHSSLANAARAGRSEMALMVLAGHSGLRTTRRYLHLAGEMFRGEAEWMGLALWQRTPATGSCDRKPGSECDDGNADCDGILPVGWPMSRAGTSAPAGRRVPLQLGAPQVDGAADTDGDHNRGDEDPHVRRSSPAASAGASGYKDPGTSRPPGCRSRPT